MTCVGGLLLIMDRSAPRADGFTLTPLATAATTSSIEAIFRTTTELDRKRWQAIVIHHSGSSASDADSIAREHQSRGSKGLGHHFIIGNGRKMDDGELYVGYRWQDQAPGAHAGGAKGPWYNQHAISICLVGDGNRQKFTPAQLARLEHLISTLCTELKIPRDRVVLARDIAPVSGPGKLFPEAWLRESLGR